MAGSLSLYRLGNMGIVLLGMLALSLSAKADDSLMVHPDTISPAMKAQMESDSIFQIYPEDLTVQGKQLVTDSLRVLADTLGVPVKLNVKQRWIPNPNKALWLAIVLPGAGQIYNRKYWKLPLIYGGFIGCVYALNWNNTMYRDYSQAFIDIMDSDPTTDSYKNFLPQGYDVNQNLTRIQNLFKNKKNYYRRYRDLSIFAFIGVYLLSIVDAYVDAHLASFDISRDLSLKVRPSIIRDKHRWELAGNAMKSQSYGLNCALTF